MWQPKKQNGSLVRCSGAGGGRRRRVLGRCSLALLMGCLAAGGWLRLAAEEGVEITTVEKRYYLGVIVAEDADSIVVRDAQGIKSQIAKKSIAERTALQDPNDRRRELEAIFDARLAAIGAEDAPAFYELGQWAKQRGLKKQAAQAFREVLRVAPGHNGAGGELGWKLVDGKYVDPAAGAASGPATEHELLAQLAQFDPTPGATSTTDQVSEHPLVLAVKNDPAIRGNLYKIIKNAPANDKARELRRKAMVLIGRARRYDMIPALLEILLADNDTVTVEAAAQALQYMKYDRMAQVLADLAALNKVPFYRTRAMYGLAVVGDTAGIDRLLFHAGYQVAGGQSNDQHNPLIEVGGSQINAMNFIESRAPSTGRVNPEDQTPLYPALTALRALAGKDFKTDLTNWRLWWSAAKADFKYTVPAICN